MLSLRWNTPSFGSERARSDRAATLRVPHAIRVPAGAKHVFARREGPARPETDRAFAARFAVINLVGVALLAAAWAENLLMKPFQADSSGMCYLITALFLAGLIAVYRRDWQTVRWTGNVLVYLGMVGTVLGLIMTVSDLSAEKAQSFESFKAVITAIYIGSGTALYTNLIACIGYLWLGTNAHLLARQEV